MKKLIQKLFVLFVLLAAAATAKADIVQVDNASMVGSINWYRTNTYVLNGFVYVENGEVLNIEAGTVIKGNTNATPATIACLVVARGGKLFANGTANSPIVFTSVLDDELDPFDLSLYQRGLWGGVVICGRASINTASNAGGNAANPKYDVFEGLADIANHRYGGNDDDDSSGVLRYVSIRHGGKVLESNKEINGLSLCGVGRNTTVEFVECYGIADDGFEFFGGTVNTRYLVSAFNDDDAFDADQGYRGRNQFWFAIQEPGTRDKGGEFNGEPQTIAVGASPAATWEAYNVTWIGAGVGSGGANNNAFTIRDYASPRIYNSIITDFGQRGVSIDATAGGHLTSGSLQFANNIWWGFGGGNAVGNIAISTVAEVLFTDGSRSNSIVDPMLRSIDRTDSGLLDPRPSVGSPALSGARVAPDDGFYTETAYIGAFGPDNLWISGWTALSFYEVLPVRGGNVVQVNNADISGAVNWYRTNTYVLNGFVYVEEGETLSIEAGTVIKGNTNSTPATIACLVVARGGKLFANGTANNPIIFTSVLDDVDDPYDLGVYQRGLWGGVVLCGRARLNTASNAGGNASNPKYDVFEGLADIANHRYGGNDDNDSSGSLRYISIRHGGKVLESNKEINGLSLCAVGRGTIVRFVESYAIADDGFEFFGGTVNTKYLISAFNDDAFDADQGYRGTNQFWFAIQEPGTRDKGGEFNGEPQTIAVGAMPASVWELYNATWIGAGPGSGGANNNAFTIRDYASPRIFNSIVTAFAQRGVSIDATAGNHLASGDLDFRNNIWWDFGGGNSVANISITSNAEVLFNDGSRSNVIASPMLRSIGRSDDSMLDPRPQGGSPVWTGWRTPPVNGVYVNADYQGAFGDVNWAADWSALTYYGVMQGTGAGLPVNTLVAPPPVSAPSIATQPQSKASLIGSNVTFTVTATGTDPLAYQWLKAGAPISDETNASLTLLSLELTDAANYRVVVSNPYGSVTSSVAVLTINCGYNLSATTALFSSIQSAGSFAITTDAETCEWTIVNPNDWITLDVTNGSGDWTVNFTVAENLTGIARFGTITVQGRKFVVTQTGDFAPSTGLGRKFAITITQSTGTLPPSERYLFLTSGMTNMYILRASDETNSGTFTYQKTAANSATIVANGATVNLGFQTPVTGIFTLIEDDGSQVGTFVMTTITPDFNGDLRADFLLQRTDRMLAARLMDGTNLIRSVMLRDRPTAEGWLAAGSGDFDGDGKADILLQHTTRKFAVWLMDGTNFIRSVSVRGGTAAADGWRGVSFADYDGNGSGDILMQHNTGKLAVWYFNGTNYHRVEAIKNNERPPAAGWRAIGSADVFGDGSIDVVMQHADRRILVWNLVGGKFHSPYVLREGKPAAAGFNLVGCDDFNDDGRTDLLFRHLDGRLLVWLMNGATFNQAVFMGSLNSNWKIISPN